MVGQQSIFLLEASKSSIVGKRFDRHNGSNNDHLIRYVRFKKQGFEEPLRNELNLKDTLRINIVVTGADVEADTVVIWFRNNNDTFDVGLKFPDESAAFKMRALEQVCLIEKYQQDMLLKEGRELSEQEAAIEWISKFSKDYP